MSLASLDDRLSLSGKLVFVSKDHSFLADMLQEQRFGVVRHARSAARRGRT
jgi:hypothetical protein